MNLVLIWALSNAVSWALVGVNSPLGDMLYKSSFKRLIHTISLSASIVAIASTLFIFSPLSDLGTPSLNLSTVAWLAPHFLGSIYSITATATKFATNNI